jgi:hypothetical protein
MTPSCLAAAESSLLCRATLSATGRSVGQSPAAELQQASSIGLMPMAG